MNFEDTVELTASLVYQMHTGSTPKDAESDAKGQKDRMTEGCIGYPPCERK
jgi:hypothetical protein